MTRIVSTALAVVTGLRAAVLVAWGPKVTDQGRAYTCPGIIASAEADGDPERRSRACDHKQTAWAVLAGLAGLACLSAGSVAVLSRRDEEEPLRTGP